MRHFIEEVGNLIGFKRRDLIEKDFVLHGILLSLSKGSFFRENFLFKGGTCLIKSYIDYYRFSEDVDFTWKNQHIFKDMSQKEVRRYISCILDQIGRVLEGLNMDFIFDKSNRRYVELVGGNKTVTFKLWYDSEILHRPSFVKVQINFVESILFPTSERKIKSLLSGKDIRSIYAIFPDKCKEYSVEAVLQTYDIREILCEKVRSILTRRGFKERDFVDVYMIERNYGINVNDVRSQIVDKTLLMLKMYERYRESFREKADMIKEGDELFVLGEERKLMLTELDEMDFYEFVDEFRKELRDLYDDIQGRLK